MPGIYKAARELRFRENGRIRFDERAILDNGAIENDNVVLDHAIATHRTGMHHRVAPDSHAIADNRGIEVLRDMNGARLADEEFVPNADEMAVAPDRRAARYRSVRAGLDLAKDARTGTQEAHAFAKTRLDAAEGQEKRCICEGLG